MSTFPIYRKSVDSKLVIRFTSKNEGFVVDSGTTAYKVGSFHTDWISYTERYWELYDYESNQTPDKEITPETMELFFTLKLSGASSSTLTKVPNGYVMTSSSGHQLFIKDLEKDSL